MTPSPLVGVDPRRDRAAYNYNKPPRAGPISWIIKFLGPATGKGKERRGERGPERASQPAGFAFRQPLARDLRRAVTHRTHLFVLLSLSLALATAVQERCTLPRSPKGVHPRCFDRLHSPWLRDWLILHSARIPPCHVFVPSYRPV